MSIVITLLQAFEPDRFLRSSAVTSSIEWGGDKVTPLMVSQHLQALRRSGLLEMHGIKCGASYKLSPAGVAARAVMVALASRD